MPVYELELSDGRRVKVEGDQPPTDADIEGLNIPEPEHIVSGLASKQPSYLVRPPPGNFLTSPPIEPQLVREPKDVTEGLYNALVEAESSMISPLGVATAALAPVKAAQPILAGVFGGLGAKGAGEALGTLLGSQNLTPGQKAQLLGEAGGSALMALAPFAHAATKGAPDALQPESPPILRTLRSQPLEGPGQVPVQEGLQEVGRRGGQEAQGQVLPQLPQAPDVGPADVWKSLSDTRKNIEAHGYGIVASGDTVYLTDQPAGEVLRGKPMRITPDTELEAPIKKLLEQYRKDWKTASELGQEPQKVIAAAYKNPETGEVTAGSFHKEAAAEQGVKAPEAKEARETEDFGFIVQDPATGKTEFKTRPETEPIAEASGQLVQEPERPGEPHSDDIASPTEPGKTIAEQKETPPAAVTGEAQPEVPSAGKAEGGGGVARIQRESLLAQKERILQDIDDWRSGARATPGQPASGQNYQLSMREAVKELDKQLNAINEQLRSTSTTVPTERLPISRPPERPKGVQEVQKGPTKAAKGPKPSPETVSTGPLTPTESTRLKSLTEKLESGKPLTSAEQKRYRALKEKVSPPEPEGGGVVSGAESVVQHLESRAEAAKARLKKKLGGGQLGTTPDPTILFDLAEIGAAEIARTGLEFSKWSAEMVKELGENVKPYLKDAFDLASKRFAEVSQLGGGAAERGEIPETGAGGEKYGVAARVRAERAQAGQVEDVPRGTGINAPDSVQHGRELLRGGADAEKALSDFEKSGKLSSDDMALVRAHGEALAAGARTIEDQRGTDSPEYRAARDALSAWDKRSKSMQTEWHKTGMAQQGETDIDTGSFTGLQRAYERDTGKEFTPNQKQKAKQTAKKVQNAQEKSAQANARLAQEINRSVDMTAAEKRAFDAANRTVRLNNIRLAKAENAARVADAELKREVQKVQEEAGARAEKAITGLEKKRDIAGAKSENAARIKAAEQKKAVADVQLKAAQKAQAAIDKRVREAAAKLAEAERKAQSDPIKRVWDKAKEYLDKNQGILESPDELITKIASDLKMTREQVRRAMAQNSKVKYLADEAWRKQQGVRILQQQAKQWVRNLSTPGLLRALTYVPRVMFGLKVGFHGTVALGTHAPMVAFQPKFWSTYITDFGKMYKMVGSKAYYETQIQDLVRRPNYVTARRAGLVNDPFTFEDLNSPDTVKYFGKTTGMGNRGYSVLKIIRQDMFDQLFDALPESQKKMPEIAKSLADGINHSTGVTKAPAPKGMHVALFAPRLAASRVAWLVVDPAKTMATFARWSKATPGEKAFAKYVMQEKAWVAGTMFAALAINQGFLLATGSKQKINFTDPTAGDFLHFKVAGQDVSYGNPMLNMAKLPLRVGMVGAAGPRGSKHVPADEKAYTVMGRYIRSQASPFTGTAADLVFREDPSGRPLPHSTQPVPLRLRRQGVQRYTWPEYLTETVLPIPAQEAIKETWKYGLGMSDKQIDAYMKAFAKTAFMAGTGARTYEDKSVPATPTQ